MGSEKVDWAINGELALNCNCTVFCPCAVSLGDHPPTEGYCQTWLAVRIDNGHFRDVDLSGLNVGMLMEIPGKMARGNWTLVHLLMIALAKRLSTLSIKYSQEKLVVQQVCFQS